MIESKEIRALSRGVGCKLFNDQVHQRYSDNETLRDTCLIRDWDTMPEITYKQNTFFFTLGNFTPVHEEKVYMRNKVKSDDTPWMVLHLKFKEQFIKDRETGQIKPLGQRRIKVNNIDVTAIDPERVKKAFDGKSIIYGNKYVTYNFTNGKEIRLEHIETEPMGIDLISSCLPFTVKTTQHEGSLIDNILTVNKPKNTPRVDTYGLRGHIWKVTFHQQEGKKTNQLYRVLIANTAKVAK